MFAFVKRFAEWVALKESLHNRNHKIPHVSERQLWWVGFGENIGSEIDGKSAKFSRPAIIYKKLSHGFYLVIPTSTKEKTGSWYVPFVHKNIKNVACLHQIRVIDYRRLYSRIGRLDDSDFEKVRTGFKRLYE